MPGLLASVRMITFQRVRGPTSRVRDKMPVITVNSSKDPMFTGHLDLQNLWSWKVDRGVPKGETVRGLMKVLPDFYHQNDLKKS